MKKRKTAQDYRKEYNELIENQRSLEAHITARLSELSQRFPDAIIVKKYDDFIKAKCLTPSYIDTLDIETRMQYIGAIEDWNSRLETAVQLEIS